MGNEIEIRVSELRQLFDAIDPSPFGERDLDPRAVAFIIAWARDLRRDAPLALRVHLDRPSGRSDDEALLREAVHQFFAARAEASRRSLRELFRRGRISLVIALGFLAAATAASDLLRSYGGGFTELLRQGLVIGGWVAMWRPLEVFLYDWWPIVGEIRLLDRLAAMPVRIDPGHPVGESA